MNNLSKKKSGLHLELYGNFVTEREYVKEWSNEIIQSGSIASIDQFESDYGSNYNLDDDNTYNDFNHLFSVEVHKCRINVLTIILDTADLQKSKVSLPKQENTIDFEDCDLETTSNILSGLEVQYNLSELELNFEELDIFECDRYISYIDNENLVIKTEITDTNFTVKEFVDYQFERFESEVSIKQILQALDLPEEQCVF